MPNYVQHNKFYCYNISCSSGNSEEPFAGLKYSSKQILILNKGMQRSQRRKYVLLNLT